MVAKRIVDPSERALSTRFVLSNGTKGFVIAAIKDATADADGSELNLLLSNGRQMFALRHGAALGYTEQTGLRESSTGGEPEEPRPGSPLLRYVTTTTHHDLHHSSGRYNYGLYFTWWDRWMGTEHPEYVRRFR